MKIGIIGGGQLGRMLIQEGLNYNLEWLVLSSQKESPCKNIAVNVLGDETDYKTIVEFGQRCNVVTIEMENVNVKALKQLEDNGVMVRPSSNIVRMAKDKRLQKKFFKENNIPTADFYTIQDAKEIKNYPCVNKKSIGGYDGNGVKILREPGDVFPESIIEEYINFDKELATIVARDSQGNIQIYPPVELVFKKDINLLEYLIYPTEISADIQTQINKIATKIATLSNLIGIVAIEMFLVSGKVIVNEIAPRPHNSGHHTMDVCNISQYDQLIRCLIDLPLVKPQIKFPCIMMNLLGECYNNKIYTLFKNAYTKIHMYGKNVRKNRKMGHMTIYGADLANVLAAYREITGCKIKMSIRHVAIIMGSSSDLEVMRGAMNILKKFSIDYELKIVSAHRTPELMIEYAKTAANRGFKVIIAGAGGAAHLPGMIASVTTLPVIGVPIKSSNSIDGWDSILSILQMPTGVPVATVALNASENAGILASQIIGIDLTEYKEELKHKVAKMNQDLL